MDKLTLMVGGILIAGAAVIYLNLNQNPDIGAKLVAPVDSTPMVAVKLPSKLSALAQVGETAFNENCSACHGPNASGLEGAAPPLVHKIYEPSHHGDVSFYLAVKNGVRAHHWRFGSMPPVEGLTQGDVEGIVAYVRELQRENGIN